MRLYAAIGQTLRTFDPAVYRSGPASLAAATGDGEGLGLLERRRLRGQARSLWLGAAKATWEDLHTALDVAASRPPTRPSRKKTPSSPTPRIP